VPEQSWTSPTTVLQQLALNFLETFLNRHLLNNDRLLVATVHKVHLYQTVWALNVALSSPRPLLYTSRQHIWPFTTNKALSGPPLHRYRALVPSCPPVGRFGGGLRRLCLHHCVGPVSLQSISGVISRNGRNLPSAAGLPLSFSSWAYVRQGFGAYGTPGVYRFSAFSYAKPSNFRHNFRLTRKSKRRRCKSCSWYHFSFQHRF